MLALSPFATSLWLTVPSYCGLKWTLFLYPSVLTQPQVAVKTTPVLGLGEAPVWGNVISGVAAVMILNQVDRKVSQNGALVLLLP